MSWDKLVGPATLVYLVSATVAALWWASGIDHDVKDLKANQVTDGRISKLEEKVDALKSGTGELKTSINDLARELRRDGR